MCGGAAPARIARSSVGDARSPGNNGIAGTDLPPIYYENKQRGLPETRECLVTIYRARLKGFGQVSRILVLLLLTTSA